MECGYCRTRGIFLCKELQPTEQLDTISRKKLCVHGFQEEMAAPLPVLQSVFQGMYPASKDSVVAQNITEKTEQESQSCEQTQGGEEQSANSPRDADESSVEGGKGEGNLDTEDDFAPYEDRILEISQKVIHFCKDLGPLPLSTRFEAFKIVGTIAKYQCNNDCRLRMFLVLTEIITDTPVMENLGRSNYPIQGEILSLGTNLGIFS